MLNNNQLPKLLVTGSSGLVGDTLKRELSASWQIIGLDLSDPNLPVDITNLDSLRAALSQHSDAEALVHLAAYTDVTAAHQQQGDKSGSVYKINVDGTANVAKVCAELGIHLLHISTAFIFDGKKDSPYVETDTPNPIEWYGATKLWAEEKVLDTANLTASILRIDKPFRSLPFSKLDEAHRVATAIKNGSLPPVFTNHFFGPTVLEDLSLIIDWFAKQKTTGIWHATAGEEWSDYNFAQAINELHNLNADIKAGDLFVYLKTAPRPYQPRTSMNTNKLRSVLPFNLTNIRDALAKLVIA